MAGNAIFEEIGPVIESRIPYNLDLTASRGAVITAGVLMLAGGVIILSSAIYDIATAKRSARQYNEAHGLTTRITPTVGPEGEQIGLALRMHF